MAAEKKLEERLRDQVKKLGGTALKFWCVSFTGMPDRIVLMPGGRIWFVEMKAPGKWVIKGSRQEAVINWLRGLGFKVWVINSAELIDEFLNQVEG